MNFWYKLALFVAFTASVFGGGMLTEYKFHLASQTLVAEAQTKKAQEGQNNIIKFNQEADKAYAKSNDKCLTSTVPADVQRLLK